MAKREEMVNMRLLFSKEEHRKLAKKKDAWGLTWEEAVIKAFGIEDE